MLLIVMLHPKANYLTINQQDTISATTTAHVDKYCYIIKLLRNHHLANSLQLINYAHAFCTYWRVFDLLGFVITFIRPIP